MSDAWVASVLELFTIIGTSLGVLVTIWPPQKKGRPILITIFALIAVTASWLVWIQANRARVAGEKVQHTLDSVLSIESQNQEDQIRQIARDRSLRKGLQSLIDKGDELRENCQGWLPSRAEDKWIKSAQRYLIAEGRRNDAEEFVHSSEIVRHQICIPRITGYMSSLERIRDSIPDR